LEGGVRRSLQINLYLICEVTLCNSFHMNRIAVVKDLGSWKLISLLP
jgi:hypothetical protein